MEASEFWFLALIALTAFCYSSVGHGGASGYLALLAVFGMHQQQMRSSALVLNVLVAAIAFYHFARSGFFSWKVFYPFAVSSVPMAFLGGMFTVETALYRKILGVCLLLSVVRMIGFKTVSGDLRKFLPFQGILTGGFIGFISGLIGIGGGVLLSPLILLMRWSDVKQTAAVSALFIVVNSVSGLAGIAYARQFEMSSQVFLWIVAAAFGAIAGSYAGTARFSFPAMKAMLALVMLIASTKLIFS